MEAITLPVDITVLTSLKGGEPRCFHCFSCCFVSGWKWWTQVSSIVTNFWRKLLESAPKSEMVRAFAHGVIGRRIDPSRWTHWAIYHSSQCSTTGVKKAVVCFILSGMMHIKEPLRLIGKSSLCGSSGFLLSLSEWSFTICLMPYNHK